MSNYNNNNNNSNFNNGNKENAPVAFLVPHEDKSGGTFWKGTMDLGGGKAIKIVMFQNNKPDTKSDFIVNGYKKAYNTKPTTHKPKW